MRPITGLTVCIVSRSPLAELETFIRAHVEGLPFRIVYVHLDGCRAFLGGEPLASRPGRGVGVLSRALNLLPRVLEYRIRTRIETRPDALDGLAQFLVDRSVDVVLAEYGTTAATITNVCASVNVPLVTHFHGFDASRHGVIAEFSKSYMEMFEYASSIIVVSKPMQDAVVALGCNPKKIVVSHYGPDPDFLTVEPAYDGKQLIAVGRLTDKKAPHLALLAFAYAAERDPTLHFHLIGDGNLTGVCRDIVTAMGLGNRVTFGGKGTPLQIRAALGRSFLFIQHSVVAIDGDSEGTPVAILEASASALPVIATKHGGIPEVVEDGSSGILVDEFDIIGMGEAILRLAADRSLVRALGKEGRKLAIDRFALSRHLADVESAVLAAQHSTKS